MDIFNYFVYAYIEKNIACAKYTCKRTFKRKYIFLDIVLHFNFAFTFGGIGKKEKKRKSFFIRNC